MIKRALPVIVMSLVIAAVIFMARNFIADESKTTISKTSPAPQLIINDQKFEINGQKVVGLQPGKEKEEIRNLKVANTPSPEWEPALEKTIRAQGGKSLKEVSLKKVDSFVWVHDGIALFVESIIVTLKNDKNNVTKFRVLVDAQTGKILNNWDQPVIDNLDPKDQFRVSIDPRYHSD